MILVLALRWAAALVLGVALMSGLGTGQIAAAGPSACVFGSACFGLPTPAPYVVDLSTGDRSATLRLASIANIEVDVQNGPAAGSLVTRVATVEADGYFVVHNRTDSTLRVTVSRDNLFHVEHVARGGTLHYRPVS